MLHLTRLMAHRPRRAHCALLLSTVAFACGAAAENLSPIAWTAAQSEAAGVRTLTLALAPVQHSAGLVLQGQVELPPQATELLSAPLAGVVQQVLVAPGERVKAGQVIARLLSPELLTWQRDMAQAQSQARLAASKQARDELLHAEGIVAAQRLQESRALNEQAQLALQERQQALRSLGLAGQGGLQAQLLLRATAAATVLEVSALPGQRLDAGMPVAKLARTGRLVLVLQASAEQARQLRVGDTLAVEGCQAPARLATIVPQMLSANQTVQVRADFTSAEDCLRLQQFVQATVRPLKGEGGQAAQGLTVPAHAVVRQAGKTYVFVRGANGFVPTVVELAGAAQGSGPQALLPVRSGVKAGDEVVVGGLAALKGAWLGLGQEGKEP